MVSFFGILVRPRTAIAIVVVVAVGISASVWAARSPSPRQPRHTGVTLIQDINQGTSFRSNVDNLNKSASYTFDLENFNSFGIYVRHVGSRVPGLTLLKTVEWSTPQYDSPRSSLSETLSYRLGTCGLIPRRPVNTTLQVRTYNGYWQTIRLSLNGDGTDQWQTMIFSSFCSAPLE